jgi:hypothetical protein
MTHRFVWLDEDAPARGGQWMTLDEQGADQPQVLSDVCAAHRAGELRADPLPVHVQATLTVVEAAGDLEDEGFPDAGDRLRATLDADRYHEATIDPSTPAGDRLRQAAEALEKLAADLAELVEEQLDGGSLGNLPPDSTRALCQATQAAWRLRRYVDPPGGLFL